MKKDKKKEKKKQNWGRKRGVSPLETTKTGGGGRRRDDAFCVVADWSVWGTQE